jgi:hypothetical protein
MIYYVVVPSFLAHAKPADWGDSVVVVAQDRIPPSVVEDEAGYCQWCHSILVGPCSSEEEAKTKCPNAYGETKRGKR